MRKLYFLLLAVSIVIFSKAQVSVSARTSIANPDRTTIVHGPANGSDANSNGVVDLVGPTIALTPLTDVCDITTTTTNRTLIATITDVDGVPVAGAGLPVLYWQINVLPFVGVTGVSLGGGQYEFTFGAGAVAGDAISYYIVAQDEATIPNVSVLPSAGADLLTANPPNAAIPPNSPYFYIVTSPLTAPVITPGATVICAGSVQTLTTNVATTWSPVTGLYTDASATVPYTGTLVTAVIAKPATTTTYTATRNAGTCTSSSTVTVTVNTLPTVNAVSNQVICNGAPVTAIAFTGGTPGTVFKWTNNTTSIGLAASGTGNIATFNGTNTTTAPVVATITVTPEHTSGGTTCTGTPTTFTITVHPALSISAQPVNRTICAGANTTYSVTATTGATYQWQVDPGTGFVNLANTAPYSGATTNTLTITGATTAISGRSYRAVVTSPCGNVNSTAATLTVNPAPTVSVTPNNKCTPDTMTASGTANTFSWAPATGLNVTTGATVIANPVFNTTYTVTGTITATGCTNTTTVNVLATPAAPTVTPSSPTVCLNGIAQLNAVTTGTTNATTGTVTVAIPDASATGATSVINMSGVPEGATVTGVSVNINATHTNDGDLMFNLKAPNGNVLNLVNRRGADGDNFVNTVISSTATTAIATGTAPFTGTFLPDATTAVGPTGFESNVSAFSNLYSVPNGNWTLAIRDNSTGETGTLTSWTVNITYSVPGVAWTPVTGLFIDPAAAVPYTAGTVLTTVYAKPATTTTYSVTRSTATCTSLPGTVTVTVVQPITISTQPTNVTACIGSNATFALTTTGNLISYQWQLSTDGGTTWNNIAGANNASLVLTGVTSTMNSYRYRVQLNNSCSSVTSNSATLTVTTPTAPTVTPLVNRICVSDTLIPLTATPLGGSWSGVGVSGNNFIPVATAPGTYVLTYSYLNAVGCTASATVTAKVESCPERAVQLNDGGVIVFPNPNNGRFNIRINSTLYNYIGMRIYNSQGNLLKVLSYSGLVYGRVIPIDLTSMPSGVYIVKIYYDSGVRSSEETFKTIIAR